MMAQASGLVQPGHSSLSGSPAASSPPAATPKVATAAVPSTRLLAAASSTDGMRAAYLPSRTCNARRAAGRSEGEQVRAAGRGGGCWSLCSSE